MDEGILQSGDQPRDKLDQVKALRRTISDNGYRPVAIWSPNACDEVGKPIAGAGKAPQGRDWRQRALADPPHAVTAAVSSLALNTGILCGEIIAVDIDILVGWLADRAANRIQHMLGPTRLRRIGRAPKILLVYRVDRPLTKLATPPKLYLPDETKVQVEVLGDGQQFVAFGTHPDTGQPYRWLEASPATMPMHELPVVIEESLREMLVEVESILREAGAVEKEQDRPAGGAPTPRQTQRRTDDSGFFRRVNTTVLAYLDRWVPRLFPKANFQRGTGAWRVSSEELGRHLQEDLSIHPNGIRDFGLEKKDLTAIDVVVDYAKAAPDAITAAHWLCKQIGFRPESLGWRERRAFDEGGLDELDRRAPSPEGAPDDAPGEPAPEQTDRGPPSEESGLQQIDLETGDDDLGDSDEPPADNGNGTEPTQEKIEQQHAAIEAAMEDTLAALNRRFAVVNETGKCLVIKRTRDPAFRNRAVLERISFDDFDKMYCNRSIKVIARKLTNSGVEYSISNRNLASWWLEHPRRRQYLGGVTFDPSGRAPSNFLNLWRGLAVKSKPGGWSLMRKHILEVICRGESPSGEYFLNWLARLVQHPDEPGEVALVIRSDEKGTGKGLVGRYVARLFGHHGMQITHAAHLVGRFNAHLQDLCVLFADEAFLAGDRQHEAVLKGLITEYSITVEGKYRNAVPVRNRLHLIIVSNNEWVIPASIDERRYAVFEALAAYQGDRAYFAAIIEQMENGGLEAMLHELLNRDISGFEVRDVPQTDALQEQKKHSLPSPARWWLDVLAREFVWKSRHGAPWFLTWESFYTTELLHRSYLQWCEANRVADRKTREQLGKFLTELYEASRPRGEHPIYEIDSIDRSETRDRYEFGHKTQSGKPLDKVAIAYQEHPPGYKVGELTEARDKFALKMTGITLPWATQYD